MRSNPKTSDYAKIEYVFFVKIIDKTKEFMDNCLCKERREKCGLL